MRKKIKQQSERYTQNEREREKRFDLCNTAEKRRRKIHLRCVNKKTREREKKIKTSIK